jgi:hypothetical protein
VRVNRVQQFRWYLAISHVDRWTGGVDFFKTRSPLEGERHFRATGAGINEVAAVAQRSVEGLLGERRDNCPAKPSNLLGPLGGSKPAPAMRARAIGGSPRCVGDFL